MPERVLKRYSEVRLQIFRIVIKNMNKNNNLRYSFVSLCAAAMVSVAGTAWAQVAFVLNSAEDTVSLIDTKTYKEISRNRVGREPHHLMATPDDKSDRRQRAKQRSGIF